MPARMHRLVAGFILFVSALLPLGAIADSGRVALVVGNGDYGPAIGNLRNPANDAKLMARSLKKLGFAVTLAIDVDQKEMKRHIRDFGAALTAAGPDGIGFFYYAGHGVQVDGTNYLLPVGVQIESEGDVELEAVSASSVLAQMQYARNSVNLVFLDACRNNPLTHGFRDTTRGLARVDAPRGSFIGYSTAPGEVSVDGNGNNSPYTLALAEELLRPGEAIETVHRAVRLKVLAATNEQQTPWDSSSLTAAVTLAAPQLPAENPAPVPAPATVAAAPDTAASRQAEILFWESARGSDNPAVYAAYLKQFPGGIYAVFAQAELDRLSGKQPAAASAPTIQPVHPPAPTDIAAVAPAPMATEPIDSGIMPIRGTYVAIKNANIRAEPNAKAKILGRLKIHESISVTGRSADDEWLQVAGAGGTGYISAKLLRIDPSVAARTPAPEPPPPAPEPKANALRLADLLRPEIERYLANSQAQTGNFRFLAVNESGDKIGISINCKMKKSGWGGWSAEGCSEEAEARKQALSACGDNCRIIFKRAEKVGDFEIEWVKADGGTEPAALPGADQEAQTPEPAPAETASIAPAVAASSGDIVRIAESHREDVERYLANSQTQTGSFRFLAVSPTGDRIGISIGCKIKATGWGGWSQQGCSAEADAKRMAIKACGEDCHIIFRGADKLADFAIEWY
ncbi:caspase family protein [Dongia sp.]|uniref:caspase family protein n=1 Tax=Dongia sp. TaxID=1977262 RepID=UPI0035B4DA41